MTVTFEQPFNQKIRIAGLRLSALALLPLLALGASAWDALPETLLHSAGILCVVAAVWGGSGPSCTSAAARTGP